MKLQTQIPLSIADDSMDYDSRLLLLGSCFAENIGNKFGYYKFQSLVNPFGILYQSTAIQNFAKKVVSGQEFLENHMVLSSDQWQCLDAHSDLGRSSKGETLEAIENATGKALECIDRLTHVVITLGTAWAYEYKTTNRIVANCHKLPQNNFNKVLLEPVTIVSSLRDTISLLKRRSPDVKVILTISPVRHLRDGFVENQRSKANLITAVHEILEQMPEVAYFPAYEIMMDELRDYRFYDRDMVHPNPLAIDYIWEKFASVWISKEAKAVMEKVVAVQNGLNHRPFNPESDKHQEFQKTLDKKITYLQKEYPFMKF